MSQKYVYSEDFYRSVDSRASNAAKFVFEILGNFFKIGSVVDVGCGSGAWVRTALDLGVNCAFGVDLQSSLSLIEANEDFHAFLKEGKIRLVERDFVEDVETSLPAADLALCLEVAEHLPTDVSKSLVARLTEASNIVVFSAALPGQGGTYHINEQPMKFWISEFAEFGFEPYDVFRDILATHQSVPRFYALNMLLFVSKAIQATDTMLTESNSLQAYKITRFNQLDKRTMVERVRYSLVRLLPVKIVTLLSQRFRY
jgi:SAM-dependent methyltransferase